MKPLLLLATATAAALLSRQAQSMLLVEEDFPEMMESNCQRQIASVCSFKPRENDLLFGGVANKIACLTENASKFESKCLLKELESAVNYIESSKEKSCKDELRDKCGKQIDQFKKAVQHTEIIGAIKGAVDVVECVVSHAEDLWNHCKPGHHAASKEEEPQLVELMAEFKCLPQAMALCPPKDHKVMGLAANLGCLAEKSSILGAECTQEAMKFNIEVMESSNDQPCQDELRKKCGKQIDDLKKQLQKTSVVGIVQAAVSVVQCVAENAEDLWNKCKPFEKNAEIIEEDCMSRAIALCPTPKNKIMGLGFSLGCIAEQSPLLGMECTAEAMTSVLEDMENADDKTCQDELRKKCGKQIDELKKQIQKTSVIGIVQAAVTVVQCVAENAEDLWKKCSPFDEEQQMEDAKMEDALLDITFTGGAPTPPTRKPTHKPTKATKKPTKKPTAKPTANPTKSAPTPKPTPQKIQEAILGDSEDVIEMVYLEDAPINPEVNAQVTSVEFDMDACVRSARKHCMRQVQEFNQSPFDPTMLQALNDCIEYNAPQIEAECVVATSSWSNYYPVVFRSHEPCRHPDDMTNNLPVCEPKHKCNVGNHHKMGAAIFGLIFFLVFAKVTVRCFRGPKKDSCKTGCCGTPSKAAVPTAGYVALKSDNADSVPVGAIV